MDGQAFAPKELRAEMEGPNLPATVPEVVLKGEELLDKAKSVAQEIEERVRQVATGAPARRSGSVSSAGVPSG
jgi:hypothetical protein